MKSIKDSIIVFTTLHSEDNNNYEGNGGINGNNNNNNINDDINNKLFKTSFLN